MEITCMRGWMQLPGIFITCGVECGNNMHVWMDTTVKTTYMFGCIQLLGIFITCGKCLRGNALLFHA